MERKEDKIVERFNMGRIAAETRMPLVCIYEHPADYPQQYVARLWDIQQPTNIVVLADTLDEIRQAVPEGMVCIRRRERDDPCIVEVWI